MHYTYHIGPKAQEIVNRDKDVISPSYPRATRSSWNQVAV